MSEGAVLGGRRRARKGPNPQAAELPIRPSPAAGEGRGGKRRNRAPTRPVPYPSADRGDEKVPRPMPGDEKAPLAGDPQAKAPIARLPSQQSRAVRPSPSRGWRSPPAAARGEEGWGSKFTPSPAPSSAPPRGRGTMAPRSPRPACVGGAAVSLLWRLGAAEPLPLLGPRSVLQADIRHPTEEMRERREGGVRERKGVWGEWGAKAVAPRVGKKWNWGGDGLRPGCATPRSASPFTRVPGSPAPCRPAQSAGCSDSLVRPSPHPISSRPDPGRTATRHRGAGDSPPPPPSRNPTGEGVGAEIIAVNNHTRSAAVPFSLISKRAAR